VQEQFEQLCNFYQYYFTVGLLISHVSIQVNRVAKITLFRCYGRME